MISDLLGSDIMKINLSNEKLPPKYKRHGQEFYLDPIRKRLVVITPEEIVRQKVISYIRHVIMPPEEMICVEEALAHYEINSRQRADIIIDAYNKPCGTINPLCVIECKANDIMLGDKEKDQVFSYAKKLDCDYVMLTNGTEALYYAKDTKNKITEIKQLPKYKDMLKGAYVVSKKEKPLARSAYGSLGYRLRKYRGNIIGNDTPLDKAKAMVNLYECLLDTNHKLPKKDYKMFTLIEDYGLRELTYGNASGGQFPGIYRSFLVSYEGNTNFVSLNISSYWTSSKPDSSRTFINVAIDSDDSSHHALQYSVDSYMEISNKVCSFPHTGRISVGNIGSGKIVELRTDVQKKYPKITNGEIFMLGTLKNDRLWYIDDKELVDFIENLITYALIRDDYRISVKKKRSQK